MLGRGSRIDFYDIVRRWLMLVAAGLILSACAEDEPLSKLPQGETGRVVRIIDGDALVLDTGLTVRLAGIEAPAPKRRNRIGEPYAEEAARLLENYAMGRRVRLIYPGITRDRYDRALAYVETIDALGPKVWLNWEMARQGGARVRIYPDTSALAELLLEAERLARVEAAGLWAESDYRIMQAEALLAGERGFKLVRVAGLNAVSAPDTARFDCTLTSYSSDLRIDVRRAAAGICAAPPEAALVRGYFRDGRLELTHPLNLETIAP